MKFKTIGIPKEIKSGEGRVGLRPEDVFYLKNKYIELNILVEQDAGNLSDFFINEYKASGATIVGSANSLYMNSDLIIKVKEPMDKEVSFLQYPEKTFFCYFHFASTKLDSFKNGAAYASMLPYEELIDNNELPLLSPMSEIAGKIGAHKGAELLMENGILMGGASGVEPANVLVIGGGVVGFNAAKLALGMGASVTILDKNISRIRELDILLPASHNLYSTSNTLLNQIKKADLIIGAVHSVGKKTDCIINDHHFTQMKCKTVIVDVSIDQGGCTSASTPTTHENPTYIHNGITMYCVSNMPGLTPKTSTNALCNSTIKYVDYLIEHGNLNKFYK